MKYKIPAIFSIIFLQAFHQVSAKPDQTFTVYCTGNHDTTGTCLNISNSEKIEEFDCIMVPGNIIDCKSDSDINVECILIAATSSQAEFSCNRGKAKPPTSIETTLNQEPDYQKDSINQDRTNDTSNDPEKPQSNVFTNPFKP